MAQAPYPTTPDGRYFVVRGRLWRKTNPTLSDAEVEGLVGELMDARRGLRARDRDPAVSARLRKRIEDAKQALGERGPVWWGDGAPDYNRRMARNTPYAAWFESINSS